MSQLPSSASIVRPDPAKIIVPRKHAQVLIEPPLQILAAAVKQNAGLHPLDHIDFAGQSLKSLRGEARRHFLAAANQWAKGTGAPIVQDAAEQKPWIITGHQVEFYHAGVWAKVIAADELAKRSAAVAFDLLVDHDTIDHLGFDVPSQEADRWHRAPIHWATAADLPAEALAAPTPEQFEQWDTALAFHLHAHTDTLAFMLAALKPTPFHPPAGPRLTPLPYVPWLSQARGKLERALDINVHHVPTSLLCRGDSWWKFVTAWIENAAAWTAAYNRHLAAYRQRQGIKNSQHPMPDLAHHQSADAETYELPFWIYKLGEARQRLVIKKSPAGITLIHDATEHAIADLQSSDAALQVRPRALTLTMYARLFLADLFIHGIGGALYDQITDGMLADLFAAAPPYACVSAAWLLPLGQPLENIDDIPQLKSLRHHILHNPQRALDPFTALKTDVAELIVARKGAIEEIAHSLATSRKNPDAILLRRERFRDLHNLNAALHQKAPNILTNIDRQLAEAQQAYEQNKVLLWREYFYGLHTTQSLGQLIAKVRHTEFTL